MKLANQLVLRVPPPAFWVALVALLVAIRGDAAADSAQAIARVVGKDQVTSRSVKDGSLQARDFRQSDRSGLRGDRGAKGRRGHDSVLVTSQSVAEFVIPWVQPPCPAAAFCPGSAPSYTTGTARCRPGEKVIGGGVRPADRRIVIDANESYPAPDGTGWIATVGSTGHPEAQRFTVYAICTPAPG